MYDKKNRQGRLSMRERIEQTNASHRFYAATSDRPDAQANLEKVLRQLPPKRDRVRRPVDGKPVVPLEKEVLADVLQALRNDPRIYIVDRRQSGVFVDGDRYIRVGKKGLLDISGMLNGGRYFEIECKREGEKPDDRQQQRIDLVRRGGGVSGYCWSVESALALLP